MFATVVSLDFGWYRLARVNVGITRLVMLTLYWVKGSEGTATVHVVSFIAKRANRIFQSPSKSFGRV